MTMERRLKAMERREWRRVFIKGTLCMAGSLVVMILLLLQGKFTGEYATIMLALFGGPALITTRSNIEHLIDIRANLRGIEHQKKHVA